MPRSSSTSRRTSRTTAQALWSQADERRADLEKAGDLPRGWPGAYPDPRDWKRALVEARTLELTWEPEAEGAPPGGNPFGWHDPVLPPAPIGSIGQTVRRWRSEGARVVLASDQSARLAELLGEADIVAAPHPDLSEVPPAGGTALIERSLNGGFEGGPDGVILVTDRELFGTVRVRRPRALRRVVPKDVLERLTPGDMVVHVDHGVARYAGLVRRSAGGEGAEERDFLELHFAGTDRIWVPVEQIGRVTRYAGGEDPQLSRLGGGEWQRARTRVRKAVRDLAKDLLALYAARANVAGHAFGDDTPWQSEMEAAFPYQETADQLRAILEVKADLERPTPMDRIVVGDVGYGKTEVAIRAAFKAVQEGTQVAVLVPTTVLAAQHLATLQARFAAYPMTVRMLSRFVSAAEQKATLDGPGRGLGGRRRRHPSAAEQGHPVPGPGAAHRRRGAALRRRPQGAPQAAADRGARPDPVGDAHPADAQHGARRGPRHERHRDAAGGPAAHPDPGRGGVGGPRQGRHPARARPGRPGRSTSTTGSRPSRPRRSSSGGWCRRARIMVGHGQMPEGVLERVMIAFARGDHDILVCTTIIESGLDIPNANTIIIDRADALGLAQLYQLRGRVGRS